jgi:aryl-alcohol dehydrogenase-like predicted oxidoreductase
MAALDDLVRAGKVRYLGVSDTPAWKIVEANLIARFRGWSSFIGLQIEYSLLQRTVEQELVPMAGEFGLGITPWSPLAGGALSGKYTRANAGQRKADRGALLELDDKTYDVVDELEIIAKAHDTSVASVALAWVHAKPGVTSIIIGARRMSQFEENIRALDVTLTAEEMARLDEITAPTFGFPQSMLPMAAALLNGGTTVNGVSAPVSEFVLPEGAKPY